MNNPNRPRKVQASTKPATVASRIATGRGGSIWATLADHFIAGNPFIGGRITVDPVRECNRSDDQGKDRSEVSDLGLSFRVAADDPHDVALILSEEIVLFVTSA